MATYKYEFTNPNTRVLHFAEGGFISADRAWAWARYALAIDRRWADDATVQDAMAGAVRCLTHIDADPVNIAYDLRLVVGDNGEQPISLRVTQEP